MLIEARYRGKVEEVVAPFYETVAELTERDILYRSRVEPALPVSCSRRYARERRLGRLAGFGRRSGDPRACGSGDATVRTCRAGRLWAVGAGRACPGDR